MTRAVAPRGAIHSPRRAKQLHDFTEMAIGTITPTDIDGLIDFHGESFAFFEVKGRGATMSRGQSLAMTRVVDLIEKAGKRAVIFEVEHHEEDAGRMVNAARCIVRRTYFEREWRDREGREMTLVQAVDAFLGRVYAPVKKFDPLPVVDWPTVETPSVDDIFKS